MNSSYSFLCKLCTNDMEINEMCNLLSGGDKIDFDRITVF